MRVFVSWLLGSLLALGSCTEPVKKPKPPNTSALLRAYRQPSGVLSDATGPAALAALDRKVSGLSALCGWKDASELVCDGLDTECTGCAGLTPLFELFDSLRSRDAADAGPSGGSLQDEVQGDGFVRVTRICPGHGKKPSPDPAHGTMELVINVSERGFDSVVFGKLDACQINVLGVPQTLRADLSITFGESWGFQGFDQLRPVVSLAGTIDAGAGEVRLASDLELGLGRQSSLALAVEAADDGQFVFFQSAQGSGFRADNGTFICDFEEGQCASQGSSARLR